MYKKSLSKKCLIYFMKLSQPIYEAVLIKTNMFMYGYPRERFSLHERELVSNFMTAMFLCCSTSYNVLRRVYGLEKKLSFASTLKILLSLRCSTSYHTLRRAWYLRSSTSNNLLKVALGMRAPRQLLVILM